MTEKDYLSQAYRLDQRINAKIEQVASLNDLATKCTAALSGMPGSPNKGRDSMSEIITKIIDLQNEINADIDRLVDLKREIGEVISRVDSAEEQVVLERRYLCFETWEKIASVMGFNVRHVYRIHKSALKNVSI